MNIMLFDENNDPITWEAPTLKSARIVYMSLFYWLQKLTLF